MGSKARDFKIGEKVSSFSSTVCKSPTWTEGWFACAAGWSLYEGHSELYQAGGLARKRLVTGGKNQTEGDEK